MGYLQQVYLASPGLNYDVPCIDLICGNRYGKILKIDKCM